MEKISFTLDDGETAEFFVEEQTTLNGMNYLLVSDSEEDEAEAYILRDMSDMDSREACYEFVEDEEELIAVSKVFEQILEDTDIKM